MTETFFLKKKLFLIAFMEIVWYWQNALLQYVTFSKIIELWSNYERFIFNIELILQPANLKGNIPVIM